MRLDLFGFDFFPKDSIYGFWFFDINTCEKFHRSLFCIYYTEGELFIHLGFFKIGSFFING